MVKHQLLSALLVRTELLDINPDLYDPSSLKIVSLKMKLSFEFFPPKTDEGLLHLLDTAKSLTRFSPEYFSVTYGAGGSTQEFTLKTIDTLQQHGKIVAPHISCIGATKAHVLSLLKHYQMEGIRHLVAVRGDLPSGNGSLMGDFHYARDLVHFIREQTGDHFKIAVGVYPECHPQAKSFSQDLLYFKEKVDAGADSAITQYFYHPEAYGRLVADCKKLGIDIPIVPGIMPIYNFSQLSRFSEVCGAEIPRFIRKRMESLGDDIEAIQALGIEIVTHLCENLIKIGVPGLHFYTLNKYKVIEQIIENLKHKGLI